MKRKTEPKRRPFPRMYISFRNPMNKISKQTKRQSGFTLVELMVAMAVGAVVTTMLVVVATRGLRHTKSVLREERLHANATLLANVLNYWVKQASALGGDADTLIITLPDASTKTIEKAGTAITLDGTPITTEDVTIASANFSVFARSASLYFSLETENGAEQFSATATAAMRQ